MIVLVEITGFLPEIQDRQVYRFCTGTGYRTGPTDDPADVEYLPYVIDPGSVTVNMFEPGATGGGSSIGYGFVSLNNQDGRLDFLRRVIFAGESMVVMIGGEADPRNTFETVMTVTVDQPTFGDGVVDFHQRDKTVILDVPVQKNLYGGTNALPNGVDGVPGDIKNQPKPIARGYVPNGTPKFVNTSLLIYQYNDGAATSLTNVKDKGVALTKGADYTSLSDMTTNAPAAGEFRCWPGGGLFRLGSSPAGAVTFDLLDSRQTAAPIIQEMVVLAVGDYGYSYADFSRLATDLTAVTGIYITDPDVTVRQVIDSLCATFGLGWWFDAAGKFRIRRFVGPRYSNAVFGNEISCERVSSGDSDKGVPIWKYTLRYDKVYTVQSATDLAPAVPQSQVGYLGQEYRTAVYSRQSIQNMLPLSPAMEGIALFRDQGEAANEAYRRFELYSVPRERIRLTLPLEEEESRYWDGSVYSLGSSTTNQATALVHDDILYVIDSYSGSVTWHDLSHPEDGWFSDIAAVPGTNYFHAPFVAQKYLYALGGSSSSALYRLDLSNRGAGWTQITPLTFPGGVAVQSLSCVQYGRRVYFMVGTDFNSQQLAYIDLDYTDAGVILVGGSTISTSYYTDMVLVGPRIYLHSSGKMYVWTIGASAAWTQMDDITRLTDWNSTKADLTVIGGAIYLHRWIYRQAWQGGSIWVTWAFDLVTGLFYDPNIPTLKTNNNALPMVAYRGALLAVDGTFMVEAIYLCQLYGLMKTLRHGTLCNTVHYDSTEGGYDELKRLGTFQFHRNGIGATMAGVTLEHHLPRFITGKYSGAVIVEESTTNIAPYRKNVVTGSLAVSAGTYTASVQRGTGTMKLTASGATLGYASLGSPLTLTIDPGATVTFVPQGVVDLFQFEQKPYATTWIDGYRWEEAVDYPAYIQQPTIAATTGTFQMWVMFHALPGGRNQVLFAHFSLSNILYFDGTRMAMSVQDGSTVRAITTSFAPSVNTWHLVAVRWTPALVELWMDDAVIGSVACTTGMVPYGWPAFSLGANAALADTGRESMQGRLCEFIAVDYVKSDEELLDNYNSTEALPMTDRTVFMARMAGNLDLCAPGGKQFTVIGTELDLGEETLILDCWG